MSTWQTHDHKVFPLHDLLKLFDTNLAKQEGAFQGIMKTPLLNRWKGGLREGVHSVSFKNNSW